MAYSWIAKPCINQNCFKHGRELLKHGYLGIAFEQKKTPCLLKLTITKLLYSFPIFDDPRKFKWFLNSVIT